MVNTSETLHPYLIDFSTLYQRAEAISHAYHSRNLVFFLGAGASKAFAQSMPSWDELLRSLSRLPFENEQRKAEISTLIDDRRYSLAAEAIREYVITTERDKHKAVDEEVAKLLKKRLKKPTGNPSLHLAILDFALPVFTTNYDTIIEDLIKEYQIATYPRYTYEDERDAENLLDPTKRHDKYVFKLHGSIHKAQRLILDEEDYADFYFYAKWPTSLQLLRHILATKMVVFIGFSLSDPEIMLILREATRHSGSYQHIALMYEPEVTMIEKKVMQQTYRVDPVLYKEHAHLPLFVMEMRTFFPRENISLQLQPSKQKLERAVSAIKKDQDVLQGCSTILFGSFAKYGYLSRPKNDIDILFLTKDETLYSIIDTECAKDILARRVDATAMTRAEFAELLRSGDPFASSVLVTGCALEDPNDHFRILARGFRGHYTDEAILRNAENRYRRRWLRVCVYEDADPKTYLEACNQWALTSMQLYILKDADYIQSDDPGSLLSLNLLGNFRYTIRRFAAAFENVDEEFFLSLFRTAKGVLPPKDNCSILEIVPKFINILNTQYDKEDLKDLLPGAFLQQADLSTIAKVYETLSDELKDLGKLPSGIGYESLHKEKMFLEKFLRISQKSEDYGETISVFDMLFFFQLQRMRESATEQLEGKQIERLCERAREHWSEQVARMRDHLSEDAKRLLQHAKSEKPVTTNEQYIPFEEAVLSSFEQDKLLTDEEDILF